MAEYAAAHDVRYAPHIGMSGIVCETASVHVAAAMPNFGVMECECDASPFKTHLADLAPGCVRQKNGTLDVPQKPGLGIEIDWKAVKKLKAE
ncbi:mandelate racemase/muconate lactonizing enzyme family protein, partial [Mesorhizobium sp. M2E.F.Ca.ET.209.01.1.1]|uniref:enolase C-terminal domain-like protein n=1 Tax=Mesorhizobium sp. M2E.F.Ca.ET.209.01.1.1 TaxID=2500526 RepID=UPI001254657C